MGKCEEPLFWGGMLLAEVLRGNHSPWWGRQGQSGGGRWKGHGWLRWRKKQLLVEVDFRRRHG